MRAVVMLTLVFGALGWALVSSFAEDWTPHQIVSVVAVITLGAGLLDRWVHS